MEYLRKTSQKASIRRNTELLVNNIYRFQLGSTTPVITDWFITTENIIIFENSKYYKTVTFLEQKLFPSKDLKYGNSFWKGYNYCQH